MVRQKSHTRIIPCPRIFLTREGRYVMRHRVKDKNEKHMTSESCRHYWIIEVANGPTSQGVCKYCGERKEFLNTMPGPTDLKRNTNPLDLPDLPRVKLDKKSKS